MRNHICRATHRPPAAAGMRPWTPANITTDLWFDAADPTTLVLNGSNVSQWNDKSGNNRHVVQATGSMQPAVTSQLNGKNVVSFDGGDVLASSGNVPLGLASRTCFIVAMEAAAVDYAGVLVVAPSSGDDWNSPSGVEYEFSGTLNGQGSIAASGSGSYGLRTPATGGLVPFTIYCESFSGTTGAAYKNGTYAAGDDGVFNAFSTGRIVIGGRFLGSSIYAGFRLNGKIAEIIYCGSALSVADRQKAEGYLAHKWGLASDLPSDHPYKTAPP